MAHIPQDAITKREARRKTTGFARARERLTDEAEFLVPTHPRRAGSHMCLLTSCAVCASTSPRAYPHSSHGLRSLAYRVRMRRGPRFVTHGRTALRLPHAHGSHAHGSITHEGVCT